MTAFDRQKLVGVLVTMAAASMVDPLRQLARGEEVDLSERALFTGAISNSGIFGWQAEAFSRANAALDIPALRGFQNDRFRQKGAAALLGGPTIGTIDSLLGIGGSVFAGEYNQKDAQKAVRLFVPFSGAWWLRKPVHDSIESFGGPKNRAQAEKQ